MQFYQSPVPEAFCSNSERIWCAPCFVQARSDVRFSAWLAKDDIIISVISKSVEFLQPLVMINEIAFLFRGGATVIFGIAVFVVLSLWAPDQPGFQRHVDRLTDLTHKTWFDWPLKSLSANGNACKTTFGNFRNTSLIGITSLSCATISIRRWPVSQVWLPIKSLIPWLDFCGAFLHPDWIFMA